MKRSLAHPRRRSSNGLEGEGRSTEVETIVCNVGCTEHHTSHLPGVGGGVLIPPISEGFFFWNVSGPCVRVDDLK